MTIHPEDLELFEKAKNLCFRLAAHIGEKCTIEPKRRPLSDGAYGLCYVREKRISILIRKKNRKEDGGKWWNKSLTEKEIFGTVAHEVAHLKFPNHGEGFKKLEKQLIKLI